MGEPAAPEAAVAEAAAAEAATSERDVLLATKLNVPGLRPDLVPRPRLAQRLDEGRGRGLVLACAPAGYGKTVLLAEWIRRGRHRVAWLSLDAGDNDPARFWRHAVAALDRARPGISERMGPLLGSPPPPSFEPLVTALINEVAGQPDADEALLLVLDDYHVISSPLVHESLGFLLEHQPPGLQLALTSRSDPPLALARLRARGQLTELRAAELRFTPPEAAALLQQVAAGPGGARPGAPLLQVPEAVAAALAARTEGWAAGLQLAGLSLRGQDDVDGFVAAFTGSHRYVLDYLAEEVLEHQSEQARAFLLETSVLERLSGPLCDAVTGRPGSQALLEEAERAGLFVVPLDEVRGWWRYHHLFADLLRARLQQEKPDEAARLHRNAAAWYAERGLADDAIRHAVAAGEMTWAARLIERHFDAAHSLRGEAATVQRWLTPLPAELVRSRPRLLLAQAVPAATGGRLEAAEQLVDAAERAYSDQGADAGDEPFEPTIGPAGSLLVNVPATIALVRGYLAQLRGDARGTAEFGSQAVAESREDEWILRSVAQVQLAVAGWLDGRLDEAERAFADGIAGRRAVGLPTWGAGPAMNWARFSTLGAGWTRPYGPASRRWKPPPGPASRRRRPRARRMWAWPSWPTSGTSSTVRWTTPNGASRCAARSSTRCPWPQAWPRWRGYGKPGAIRPVPWMRWTKPCEPAPDHHPGCSTPSRRGGRGCSWPRATSPPPPAGRRRTTSTRTMSRTTPGNRGTWCWRASCWPRAARPGAGAAGPAVRGGGRAGPGRQPDRDRRAAGAGAGRQRRGRRRGGRARRRAHAGLPAGLCPGLRRRGPADGRAAGPADRSPAVRVRVRGGRGGPARLPGPAAARARRAGRGAGCRAGRAAAAPGLVDPLTSRELEVLEMLAAGTSNQAIASQLVVTLDTVKKHVSHVLGKLGAANRTEAVARARELGLIP